MDYSDLKERITKHEGYRDSVYKDSLGKRTVGIGHLCVEDFWDDNKVYSRKFLEEIFEKDFNKAKSQAETLGLDDIEPGAFEIIIEMVFQVGIGGVGKFKKMLSALKDKQYHIAEKEMLDSRWAKQTPGRAKSLANKMGTFT